MDKETFRERLEADFPILFKSKDWRPEISIQKGWHDLVCQLCLEIQKLTVGMENPPYVLQIKEKFGSLRFYISHGTNEMFRLINECENKTSHICERCGEEGKEETVNGYWLKTLCHNCFETLNKEFCLCHGEFKKI